jgi:hypothetical protein
MAAVANMAFEMTTEEVVDLRSKANVIGTAKKPKQAWGSVVPAVEGLELVTLPLRPMANRTRVARPPAINTQVDSDDER